MPALDFAALSLPVSEDAVCGPDLDVAGDPAYLNFMARAEGLLPESYFGFDRATVDFPAQFETIAGLLAQTRDLRLLTLLAKLVVLNRDLAGFASGMDAIATLMRERWDDLHPRAAGGDAEARMATLQSLDDLPTVVLPLQHLPLFETARHGPVSYRSVMIAAGEVKARAGETALDAATIDKGLMEADLARLIESRGRLTTLRDALRRIRDVSVEHTGFEQAASFDRLPPLVDKMLAFLDGAIVRRDPSAVLPTAADAAPPAGHGEAATAVASTPTPRGRIASVAGAARALAAVSAYFSAREPSSPALLLVRQAEQLIGKSFVDVMRILLPARVPQAKVLIGAEPKFSLQLETLSALSPDAAPIAAVNGGAADDGAGATGPGEVGTRQTAIDLLEDVGAFYRITEPSSPIPLLTDRARSLTERDFLYLLKDLLPEADAPAPTKK